jgi:hypothetical protein
MFSGIGPRCYYQVNKLKFFVTDSPSDVVALGSSKGMPHSLIRQYYKDVKVTGNDKHFNLLWHMIEYGHKEL